MFLSYDDLCFRQVTIIRLYQVDAFAKRPFEGNPAAVCIIDSWPSDELMLNMAVENNLSETAFAVGSNGSYHIRWFTPGGEINLCGHATLATSYVIMNHVEPGLDHVDYDSMSGHLSVDREGDMYILDFPRIRTQRYELRSDMVSALGAEPSEVWMGERDPIFVFDSEDEVRALDPDMNGLKSLPEGLGAFVTAKGSDCDFVSRSFWPKLDVPEDPVCGSMHCSLADFWQRRLGKDEMVAHQISRRGGWIDLRCEGDRIRIGGNAALYATIDVDDSLIG